MFLACDPPEEDDGSSSGGVTRINIADAQSLVVVPASGLNSDSSLAAGSALGTEQKVLAKIKEDGTAVVVPIENPDGKLKSSSVPYNIINVNDKYLMLSFIKESSLLYWYLVRKSDGAMFDLAADMSFFHIDYKIGNMPQIQTDNEGNIYYSYSGISSSSSVVKKINVSSNSPTQQDWTNPGHDACYFVVDSVGNVLFFGKAADSQPSNNDGKVLIASSGRIQDINASFMYLGLDGKIYYSQADKKNSTTYLQKVLSQQPGADGYLASSPYGPSFTTVANLTVEPYSYILVYLEDYILYLNVNVNGNDDLDSWIELYKKGDRPAGKQTIAGLSGKYLKSYMRTLPNDPNPIQAGGGNNFYVLTKDSGIYRVDGNNYTATQIFGSNDYDVYKMAVSTDAQGDDTLTFNAVDRNNNKTVTGRVKISANGSKGKVELIKELDGVKLTLLQRVN